mmetsp:Transcript_107449/g.312460  ORF Transcript_107449/g.312460 Transcript_107449/m.312460 type:complete len:124 (-) Transcript_107449:2553-2924(-)
MDGVGKELDPEFEFIASVAPAIVELKVRRHASPCVAMRRHASPRVATRRHASPRVATRRHAKLNQTLIRLAHCPYAMVPLPFQLPFRHKQGADVYVQEQIGKSFDKFLGNLGIKSSPVSDWFK